MQKWQVAAILLGIGTVIMLTCGCLGQAAAPQETPSPIQTAVATSPPVAIIQTLPTTALTTTVTTAIPPVPAETTEAPAGDPLPKRITLNLGANAIDRFTIQNTGKVRFDITYGTSTGADKDCTMRTAYLTLVGPSYDNALDYHNSPTSSRKVLTLKPGSYTLSTNGCKGWKVVISNNF